MGPPPLRPRTNLLSNHRRGTLHHSRHLSLLLLRILRRFPPTRICSRAHEEDMLRSSSPRPLRHRTENSSPRYWPDFNGIKQSLFTMHSAQTKITMR